MTDRTKRPSETPQAKRKAKLKMYFKDRLDEEIVRTSEKLNMLYEIKAERHAAEMKAIAKRNKPVRVPKVTIPKPEYNEWGLKL